MTAYPTGCEVYVRAPHVFGRGVVRYTSVSGKVRVRLDSGTEKLFRPEHLRHLYEPPPRPGELTRPPSYDPPGTVPGLGKAPPVRARAYLEWIRLQPCAWTGSRVGVEASHHVPEGGGAMGMKTSDLDCLPLCASVHRRYHDTGAVGNMTPEQTRGWALQQINRHLGRYMTEVLGVGDGLPCLPEGDHTP